MSCTFFRKSQQPLPFGVCRGVVRQKKKVAAEVPTSLLKGIYWAYIVGWWAFETSLGCIVAQRHCKVIGTWGVTETTEQLRLCTVTLRGRIWAAARAHPEGDPNSLQIPALVGVDLPHGIR